MPAETNPPSFSPRWMKCVVTGALSFAFPVDLVFVAKAGSAWLLPTAPIAAVVSLIAMSTVVMGTMPTSIILTAIKSIMDRDKHQ